MFQRHQLASTGHIGVGFETTNGQLYVAELSASSRSGDSKDRLQNGSSDLILAILLLHAPPTAGSIGVGFGILWPTDRLQNGSSDLIRAILLLHVPTTPTSVDWTHWSRIRNNFGQRIAFRMAAQT